MTTILPYICLIILHPKIGLRCYECKFDSMDNTTQPECESGDKLKASFLKECDRTGRK